MTTTTSSQPQLPVYFDRMIAAFHAGHTGRHAHLGHWDLQNLPTKTRHAVQAPATTVGAAASDGLAAAQQRLNQQMIELAELDGTLRILDVGCGFGGLVEQLDGQVSDCDITGVNIDIRQLEICHRLKSVSENSLRWQEADACDLPFSDNTFDVVFCVEAAFHFSSRQQFLAEVWRTLKASGKLIATDFTLLESSTVPQFAIHALLNDGYGPWPDPWCRNGSLSQLLELENWHGVRVIDATSNTLPSYRYVVPSDSFLQQDPGDSATRSAMMLQWLHSNHHLRYEYLVAAKGSES